MFIYIMNMEYRYFEWTMHFLHIYINNINVNLTIVANEMQV